jgi:hypothetical protein
MKKLLLVLFSMMSIASYSQNSKLWGGLEVGYGLNLSDKGDSYKISYGGDTKMTITSLRGILGYYVIPQLSIGAGIGFNSYTVPSLNAVPVCLDIRYHPLENRNFLLNGNIGYSLATSEEEFDSKVMTDISIGYKISNIGKFSLVPAIGYNFINYSINSPFENEKNLNQSRHSLFIKVGLIY